MTNVIKLPVIAGIEITTDPEGRFNLNSLHKASGGEKKDGPSYWLALDVTEKLINELKIHNAEIPVFTARGKHGGTFAHELRAISYAGWISPRFQLQVNQTFIDYRTVSTPAIPQSLPEALRLAAELAEDKLRLEHKVEEDAPKVEFHDQVVVAFDAITMAKAAKIVGTGRNRLISFLKQSGWITRRNEPYQSKIDAGYLDVKLASWSHPDHGLQQSVTPLVTGKGLVKIRRLWEERPSDAA